MRMYNSTHILPFPIQYSMRERVRRGAQVTFYNFSVEVNNNHFLWRQILVRNATWFYSEHIKLAFNNANIAESEDHQSEFLQLHISSICSFLYVFIFTHYYEETKVALLFFEMGFGIVCFSRNSPVSR